MLIGQVIEAVQLRGVLPSLGHQRLWQVAPQGFQGPCMVCTDPLGVALGDRVLVVQGGSARLASSDLPVDATIVGVLGDHEVVTQL